MIKEKNGLQCNLLAQLIRRCYQCTRLESVQNVRTALLSLSTGILILFVWGEIASFARVISDVRAKDGTLPISARLSVRVLSEGLGVQKLLYICARR